MGYPRIKPCPRCESDEYVAVYTYDSGGRHVECDKCFYLGPCAGSIRQAIQLHNEKVQPSEAIDRRIALIRRETV